MTKREIRIETTKLALDYINAGGAIRVCPPRTCYGGESKQRNLRKFLREEVQTSLAA